MRRVLTSLQRGDSYLVTALPAQRLIRGQGSGVNVQVRR
jgi:hypothetical protein